MNTNEVTAGFGQMDRFNLGLKIDKENELAFALSYLNKTGAEKYKDILSKLIDCANDVQMNKILTKTHIDVFEYGMRQSIALVFSTYSGKFISYLSYNFEEAGAIYKRLADDKSSGIRYNAVILMLDRPPEDIVRYVLEKTCNDKSSKVRKKVADVCLRLNLNQMLPLLERQYNIEQDDGVRIRLHFSIELLKNGYLTEILNDEKMSLTIKCETGISGRFFDRKYLDIYKIENIINSYIEHKKFPWE
jgi:hypothetical protein